MARTTPRVDGNRLVLASHEASPITVGTDAWFDWLHGANTFAFTSDFGSFTARKEPRERGGSYWKAYSTAQGTLRRTYLGKTSDLTLDRLNEAAARLTSAAAPAAAPEGAALPLVPAPQSDAPAGLPPTLLATKLIVPPARAQLVARPRLFERVAAGLRGKLTLIAAPAGFGKTTLLSAWRTTQEGSKTQFAWVSLDSTDNDPRLFWSYVLSALDSLLPGVCAPALALLQSPSPQLPQIDSILASVLNAFGTAAASPPGSNIALVLEDYHVITEPPIHSGVTRLITGLPPHLHLVMVTRSDPPLPLARLRASGDLTEVRADDLRFTPVEAAAFLNQIMGLGLTPEELSALEMRTEGWIAGLQLAALALRDHRDPSGFISTFSGSNRYIVDYLAAEVIERQPANVQTFLLNTAVLDRMCAPLCDAVLAIHTPVEEFSVNAEPHVLAASYATPPSQGSSQNMLEELERANLFVVPLDEERRWYRYHHLFADVLRQRLARSLSGAAVSTLHERASIWYEDQGLVSEAIQHALMMADASRAAELIERQGLAAIVGGQVQTALSWLSRIPEELLRYHPRLYIHSALALLFTNNLPAAEARVQDAERCIRPETPPAEAQNIQGLAAAIRANIALYTGDLAGCVAYGEQVVRLLPETELIARTTARLHVARGFRVTGDVTATSERRAIAAVEPIRATRNLLGTLGAVVNVALLREMQGHLRAAAATYRELDQIITNPEDLQGPRGLYSSPVYYVGLGDLHREWNELDAADGYLAQAMELLPNTLAVDADFVARGYIALARIQHARGEHARAHETLRSLSDLAQRRGYTSLLFTRGAAVRAQFSLAEGNLSAAVTWAHESGLHADDELSFPREGEYLVLGRVWIAQAEGGVDKGAAGDFLPQSLHLLDRLMTDASTKARQASVLEILIVRALALEAQGNHPEALAAIVRALTLAAPEGYVRRFVDEGPAMLSLLRALNAGADDKAATGGGDTGRDKREAAGLASVRGYIRLLLAAFAGQRVTGNGGGTGEHIEPVPGPLAPAYFPSSLYEPLSERELEVLRLIAAGRSNAQVAQALVIALSTVKTHTNTIFSKLGVTSRTQAVARARELHLL